MGFLFGSNIGETQESVTEARKRLALAMAQRGSDTSPIARPWQGATRLVEAVMGNYDLYKQDQQQKANDAQGIAQGIAALTGQPYTPPAASEKPAGFLVSIFGGGDKTANAGATGSSMSKVDASVNVPVATTSDDMNNLIAANVPPEMQAYATKLIGKESSFNPNAVSPTGATGLAQFTRATGKQYGLVSDQGDMRKDPVANLKALVALTNDNRAGLANALGREPTDGELALAHQQGLRGAINLLSGKSVPANNLAVNNIDPNSDPRAAANKIMTFYGGSGGQQPRDVPAVAPPTSPIQPPPVNPPPAAPTPGYVDPMVTTAGRPDAPPMPPAAPSLDPSIGIPMLGAAGQMHASDPARPMPPPGAPQAALPPLPTSTVGPTPNVASVPLADDSQSQIPLEFLRSPQIANADPTKGILPVLLGGSPASPEQVAQAQQSGQARLAQSLDNAPQQEQNPMANPRVQALVQAISNPNVPPQLKAMAAQSLQTLMKPPEYGFETLPDGTIIRTDPRTGTVAPIYQATPKPAQVNGHLVDPDQRPDTIPPTEKKPGPTESERKNQALYSVIKPELKVVEDNFDGLTDPKNQIYSKLPFSEFATTPEYQKASNSLQIIVSSYLYSVAGPTVSPDEVKKQMDILTPRPGESKESVEAKKLRIRAMANAVAASGGLPPSDGPARLPTPPQGNSRPRATNPQTGEIIEFDGTQWVPVK